jgi:hypothetical protein
MPTKKKVTLEADLDPRGTRHTRPGSKIADAAIALSKPSRPKRSTADSAPSRPGSTAATRAVAATKPKRRRAR